MRIPKNFSDPSCQTSLASPFGQCSETYRRLLTETHVRWTIRKRLIRARVRGESQGTREEGGFIAGAHEGKTNERIRRSSESLAEPTRDSSIVDHPVPGLDKQVAPQENEEIAYVHLD